MIVAEKALTDDELAVLDGFLARVEGGCIPNVEALDGFFAALACCPDLVMPSEYLPVIQSGRTEDNDLVFEDMAEVKQFTGLVMRHWNHVTALRAGDWLYLESAVPSFRIVLHDISRFIECGKYFGIILTFDDKVTCESSLGSR